MTLTPAQESESDAIISDCGAYRYLLRRVWDRSKPRALFVMLNPSTADAKKDDATIRSCIRLSKALGFGSFEVVNLFSFRATKPKDLVAAKTRVGPEQEAITLAALSRCDIVICAWGSHALGRSHSSFLLQTILAHKPAVYCLGMSDSGAPKHPLYLPTGTQLETFAP